MLLDAEATHKWVASLHAIRLNEEMANALHTRSHIDPNDRASLRISARMSAQGDAVSKVACLRIGIKNDSISILNMQTSAVFVDGVTLNVESRRLAAATVTKPAPG